MTSSITQAEMTTNSAFPPCGGWGGWRVVLSFLLTIHREQLDAKAYQGQLVSTISLQISQTDCCFLGY